MTVLSSWPSVVPVPVNVEVSSTVFPAHTPLTFSADDDLPQSSQLFIGKFIRI